MRDSLWTKCLAVGIITLFIGTSVLPSISGSLGEITKNDSNSVNQISYEKTNFNNDLNSPKTLGLTDGLIGCWNFDEGRGSVAHDSSGNGNDGSINGATWTTGTYGSALEIIDTNYIGNIPASFDDSITTAITVTAWIKWYGPSSYPHDCIIFDGRGDPYIESGFSFRIDSWSADNKLFFGLNDIAGVEICRSISSIPIGSWTHVAAVFDDSLDLCRLYINGYLDNTAAITKAYHQSEAEAVIGNNHYLDNWAPINGIEDQVRIYNRALSGSEILDLYNNPSGNQPPNTPTMTGETHGRVRTLYDYTIKTADLDQDDVRYEIDWGDNTTQTTDLNESGEEIIISHIWGIEGNYSIRVKAIDEYGAESDWATLTVTMPYSFNRPILQFLELLFQRFPNAFPLLRHLMGY
jgi:hypothetical protein